MTQKHACMIIAHEYTPVLETLLRLLDDPLNDIFLHISRLTKEPLPDHYRELVKHSGFYPFSEVKVRWGGGSIFRAEHALVRQALKRGPYRYYHMLSAQDLPLKNNRRIHEFFDAHQGKEFVQLGTEQYQKDIVSRYQVYHFFEPKLGRTRDHPFWNKAETYSLAIQRRLHIDRTKNCSFTIYGGSNWFSITQELAEYFIARYPRDKRHYAFIQCTDEMVLQSMVMDSEFRERLYLPGFLDDYRASARHLDWKRGNPYVFRMEDLPELLRSEGMFARKFDARVDHEVVRALEEELRRS